MLCMKKHFRLVQKKHTPTLQLNGCSLIQEVINMLQLKVSLTCLGKTGKEPISIVDKLEKYNVKIQVMNQVFVPFCFDQHVRTYKFMITQKKKNENHSPFFKSSFKHLQNIFFY